MSSESISVDTVTNSPRLAPLPSKPVDRIAFFGTPSLAVPVLEALCDAGLDIALVVTRQDKRRGRGGALTASPVKQAALSRGLNVVHRVDDVVVEHSRQSIELGVVVAFGALIKPHVLAEIPMVNLHVSLLPRWRGAAPMERAILAGDPVTGVCLMQLEEGLDTGGIIDRREMSITDQTTVVDVGHTLMAQGTAMLLEHVRSGDFVAHPQVGEVTYAHKIEAHERRIDWNRSAVEISRLIRIGDAWTTFRQRRVKVHTASVDLVDHVSDQQGSAGVVSLDRNTVVVRCGQGQIILQSVQAEGRPRVDAADWARGLRLQDGEGFDHA